MPKPCFLLLIPCVSLSLVVFFVCEYLPLSGSLFLGLFLFVSLCIFAFLFLDSLILWMCLSLSLWVLSFCPLIQTLLLPLPVPTFPPPPPFSSHITASCLTKHYALELSQRPSGSQPAAEEKRLALGTESQGRSHLSHPDACCLCLQMIIWECAGRKWGLTSCAVALGWTAKPPTQSAAASMARPGAWTVPSVPPRTQVLLPAGSASEAKSAHETPPPKSWTVRPQIPPALAHKLPGQSSQSLES